MILIIWKIVDMYRHFWWEESESTTYVQYTLCIMFATPQVSQTDCFQYSTRSACAPGRILKANRVCVSGSTVSPCDRNQKQEAWRHVILKAGLAVSRHIIVVSQTYPCVLWYWLWKHRNHIYKHFWCQEMKLEESEKSGQLLTYNHQVSSSLNISFL